MANLLQAIKEYSPKLELQPPAQLRDLAEATALRTGLDKCEVMIALQEESESILNFCRQGRPVKLAGIGTFTPNIERDGTFSISFCMEGNFRNGISVWGEFKGVVANQENIGINNAKYKLLWDKEHPDDPLEI